MHTELRALARPFDRERFRTFIEGLGFTVTSYQLDYMEKLHNRQLATKARPVDIRNRLAYRR